MGCYIERSFFFHRWSIIPVYNCLDTCRELKLILYNHSIGLFLKPFMPGTTTSSYLRVFTEVLVLSMDSLVVQPGLRDISPTIRTA